MNIISVTPNFLTFNYSYFITLKIQIKNKTN